MPAKPSGSLGNCPHNSDQRNLPSPQLHQHEVLNNLAHQAADLGREWAREDRAPTSYYLKAEHSQENACLLEFRWLFNNNQMTSNWLLTS